MTQKILIIGHGKTGDIYARATEQLRQTEFTDIEFAVVDINPKRAATAPSALSYTDPDKAFEEFQPDTIIICSNDEARMDAFHLIEHTKSVQNVITEKPLVGRTEELEEAKRILGPHAVVMDTTENYSAIWDDFRKTMFEFGLNQKNLIHIDTCWGKNRTEDMRPTSGVVTGELIHPLSIVLRNFNVHDIAIESGVTEKGLLYLKDDGKGEMKPCIYSAQIQAKSGCSTIDFESNFAAKYQRRMLTAYYKNNEKYYSFNFEFDKPGYVDNMKTYRYANAKAKPELVREFTRRASDITDVPHSIQPLGKIGRFYYMALTAIRNEISREQFAAYGLTDLNEAVTLQTVLADILSSDRIVRKEYDRAKISDYKKPMLAVIPTF